jgi:hypothetical protein
LLETGLARAEKYVKTKAHNLLPPVLSPMLLLQICLPPPAVAAAAMLLLLLLLLLLRWHVCSVTVSHRDYSFTTENLIKTFLRKQWKLRKVQKGGPYTHVVKRKQNPW